MLVKTAKTSSVYYMPFCEKFEQFNEQVSMFCLSLDIIVPSISGRGGPEPSFTGPQRSGLAIHLHLHEGCCLHTLLSSKGHLSILMEGKHQRNPCGFLHQLQAWKLLQCGEWVVCPGRLNVGLDALVFNFAELPLWDVVTMDEAAPNPAMIEVDLCCMPPVAMSTTLAPSHVSASTTQPTIAKTLNLHIEGAFEQVE